MLLYIKARRTVELSRRTSGRLQRIVELNPTPLQGRDSFHSIKVFNDKILIL